MPEAETPGDGSDPRDRLVALDRAVREALERREAEQRKSDARELQAQSAQRGGLAWRMVTNLVTATVLAGLAGAGLDRVSGSGPFGLLAGGIVGFAVGMWLAVREGARMQARTEQDRPRSGPGAGAEGP